MAAALDRENLVLCPNQWNEALACAVRNDLIVGAVKQVDRACHLRNPGIRATVRRADDPPGAGAYRILVFPDDLKPARVVLSRGALD